MHRGSQLIEIENEKLLSLREAAKRIPSTRSGRAIHVATVYRWINRGVDGVKLEAVRVGGGLFTSVESLQRFADRCSAETAAISPNKSTARRSHQLKKAEAELDQEGI